MKPSRAAKAPTTRPAERSILILLGQSKQPVTDEELVRRSELDADRGKRTM